MLKRFLVVAVCFAFVGSLTSFAYCQTKAAEEKTGIKVGAEAPKFKLKNQKGEDKSLDDFLKESDKIAILFYRSADWCPFCKRELIQTQADLVKIKAAGIQIIGISYDSVEVLAKFTEQQKIGFPLLSDVGSLTIKAYGILNKEATGRGEGVPYPGIFIVDKKGIVLAKLFNDGYRERASTEELIAAVKAVK